MSLPLSMRPGSLPPGMFISLAAPLAGLLLFSIGSVASAQAGSSSAITPSAAATPADESATVYRGGSSRTGFAQQEAAAPLSVAWQNTVAPLSGNQSTPVENNGVVFFGTAGSVYAVNASDGSIKWTYPTAEALADPDVAHPGLFDCPATVVDGKVLIGNDDHKLYALDEATGALSWQYSTGGIIRSAPVVSDGVVYFGSGDSKLYAIREDNQQPIWGGAFRTQGQIISAAAVSAGNVYFVDGNNTLYSAALSSGRLVWSSQFDNNVADSPPILANGVIIVGSQRDLYGIAPAAGATRWHLTLPSQLTAQVALSGDGNTIYAATSDNAIVAINLRGQVQWSTPLGSPVNIAPVATNNTVVAITRTGIVRVLDATTGTVKWSYTLSSVASPRPNAMASITAVPLVTAGAIYTLADNGTLTAFRSNASDNLPPTATLVTPVQSKAVAGSQIRYSIYVNDAGSGVNPSSISLKVDGASVPVAYDINTKYITVQTTRGDFGAPIPVALPTLTSGTHALTLTISDWRGNPLNKTWNFTVNDALNPRGSVLPATATAATDANTPNTPVNSGGGGGSGDAGDPGSANAGGVTPGGAGNAGPGGSSPSSGARPTGSGGAGPVPSPATGAGPIPSTPTGPGAAPAPPAGTGGTGFPPPPPI